MGNQEAVYKQPKIERSVSQVARHEGHQLTFISYGSGKDSSPLGKYKRSMMNRRKS